MEDIRLQKLKASLTEAIQEWVNRESEKFGDWDALDTSVGDFVAENMGDAAFSVLRAYADMTAYYKNNGEID